MVKLGCEIIWSLDSIMSKFRVSGLSIPQLERPLNLKEREKEGNVDYLD